MEFCPNCGKLLKEINHGDIDFCYKDKTYFLKDMHYLKCNTCYTILLDPDDLENLDRKIDSLINKVNSKELALVESKESNICPICNSKLQIFNNKSIYRKYKLEESSKIVKCDNISYKFCPKCLEAFLTKNEIDKLNKQSDQLISNVNKPYKLEENIIIDKDVQEIVNNH